MDGARLAEKLARLPCGTEDVPNFAFMNRLYHDIVCAEYCTAFGVTTLQPYNTTMSRHPDPYLSRPIMGVNIAVVRRDEALRHIDNAVSNHDPLVVAFANANLLNIARTTPNFRDTLNEFVVLNDGIALDLASRAIHGRTFPDNLNGTDFTPFFLARTSHQLRVFILGGVPGIAQKSLQKLALTYPRHTFVGAHSGFFDESESEKIVQSIRDLKADIVLVGMGNPKQELWLARHLPDTGCKIGFAIGAFIDFSAGNVVRAPHVFRTLRIEWLFRLALEPRRLIGRYTIDTGQFLLAALRERRQKRIPSSSHY
jgi:alpha-1,3-mannosyltransferase